MQVIDGLPAVVAGVDYESEAGFIDAGFFSEFGHNVGENVSGEIFIVELGQMILSLESLEKN